MRDYAENIALIIRETTGLIAEVHPKEMPDGSQRYGVTIKREGELIAPSIYVDGFYEKGLGVYDAAKEAVKMYEDAKIDAPDLSFFTDWERVKERLFVRLLPPTFHTNLFRSAKAYGFDDLILVPYVDAKDAIHGINGSINVKQVHLEKWGVNKRTVIDTAIRNTKAQEVFTQSMGGFMEMMTGSDYGLPAGPLIISNKEQCFGAAAILGQLKKLKEKFENGFYVLPSSVHEVLVIPAELGEKAYLDTMVHEVNVTTLKSEEVLSDHAYAFLK